MSETAELWRCRRCGKWSHAKRDPIAHRPIRPDPRDPDDQLAWREEWCGPFDLWTATLAQASERQLPHIGQPVVPDEDRSRPVASDDPVPF